MSIYEITYYNNLLEKEKEDVTRYIKLFFNQNYILERKYNKNRKIYQINQEYRNCERHVEFLKNYFKIAGIEFFINNIDGIMGIKGYSDITKKLSYYATVYILILKLLYDEQMERASTSNGVFVKVSDINEKIGMFKLNKVTKSIKERKDALSLLKKYQIAEIISGEDITDPDSIIVVYTTINMLFHSDDINKLIDKYRKEE